MHNRTEEQKNIKSRTISEMNYFLNQNIFFSSHTHRNNLPIFCTIFIYKVHNEIGSTPNTTEGKITMTMKPIVLAMIICDHYYRDIHTGKSILSGTFSSINCVQFPSKHGNCAVYIALSDVATNGIVQLTFKKEDSDFSMQLPPWEVQKPESRRAVVEIGGNINGLPLPEEGYYEFVVSWNSLEISSRRLKANKIEFEQEPPMEST